MKWGRESKRKGKEVKMREEAREGREREESKSVLGL